MNLIVVDIVLLLQCWILLYVETSADYLWQNERSNADYSDSVDSVNDNSPTVP